MLLRYLGGARRPNIQDVITKDMLDLVKHIVEQRAFEPGKFEDRYEAALTELLTKKQKGLLSRPPKVRAR